MSTYTPVTYYLSLQPAELMDWATTVADMDDAASGRQPDGKGES
ncbi:hypothetical protein [Acidaminococcus intestini]